MLRFLRFLKLSTTNDKKDRLPKLKLQQLAEEKVGVLIVFTPACSQRRPLIEAVPLFFSKAVTEPAPGVKPYNALQVAGRDIYVREGCYNCHSQNDSSIPCRN